MRSRQTVSMSFSSGAYLGSHSTVSQWARAASAASASLLVWIGPLSSTSTTGVKGCPGFGTIEPVELLEMGDEIAAALGRAGVDDEFADRVIERAQQRDLLRLPRGRHTQIRACLRPGAGEVGMRQRLALVAIEQNDVAGFGLLLAQLQAQADPLDLGGVLATLQRVPRPPPAELFLRSALDSCERLMRTPACASISARRRGMVQFGRSATGASSNGVTTRNAASLFTGAGPGATVAFSAATPSRMKSLRHSRTVSSRTPNASAMRGLVQPDSVSSTARARSASPRSRSNNRRPRNGSVSRLNNPAEETIAILRCASSGPLAWGSFFHLSHRDHRGMFDVFSAHAATARVAHSKGIGLLSSGSTLPCQFGHGKVSGTSGAIRVHVLIHAVEDWETGWS